LTIKSAQHTNSSRQSSAVSSQLRATSALSTVDCRLSTFDCFLKQIRLLHTKEAISPAFWPPEIGPSAFSGQPGESPSLADNRALTLITVLLVDATLFSFQRSLSIRSRLAPPWISFQLESSATAGHSKVAGVGAPDFVGEINLSNLLELQAYLLPGTQSKACALQGVRLLGCRLRGLKQAGGSTAEGPLASNPYSKPFCVSTSCGFPPSRCGARSPLHLRPGN
jgi:hypothetical protein